MTTEIRKVTDLSVGETFFHPLFGGHNLTVEVTGPIEPVTFVGYQGGKHRMVLVPVKVIAGSDLIETATETTLTYAVEAEVILAAAPVIRHYAIGIPVGITVTGDGKVTLGFDLSEVDDLDEDDDAYSRYGDEAVAADSAIVREALKSTNYIVHNL